MKKQSLKVSIIIPVYNAEQYLEACFESLKEQTYKQLEFLFIDDCSKDRSMEMLLEFQQQDSRVVVLQTPCNGGVSAARNLGLDMATGELIGFCDADDTCERDMFQNMVSLLVDEDADISCCGLTRVSDAGECLETLWEAPAKFTMGAEEALKYWLVGKHVGNSVYTKVSRRELWEGIRFPEGQIFEEAYVIPQVMSRAKKIVHIGTFEYNYFVRGNSYTTKPVDSSKLVVYERERFIREFMGQNYPELEDAVRCFEVRTNIGMMMAAELSKKSIDKKSYNTIKKEFIAVYRKGFFNRYISVRDKIKMLELRTRIFYLRKFVFGKVQ